MGMFFQLNYLSPIGLIKIEGTDEAIYSILFSEEGNQDTRLDDGVPKVLIDCYEQLDEYFKGNRRDFTFPYIMEGTDFQKAVWTELKEISYGKTLTYKELAKSVGKEKAVQAVGNANGKNRLSIVIPCHRIVGSDGKLTGYSGGLRRKEWLLQHEKSHR